METNKHCSEAIESIDKGIEEAENITIEDALYEAVKAGRMTIKDCEECLEAYYRCFHK